MDFEREIFFKCFHRFHYDAISCKIKPLFKGNYEESLIESGNRRGFTHQEIQQKIQSVINSSVNPKDSNSTNSVEFSKLHAYDSVWIYHNGNQCLKLRYMPDLMEIGKICFFVENDSVGELHFGDIVLPIQFTLHISGKFISQVFRNSVPFPSNNHVYNISHIENLCIHKVHHLPIKNKTKNTYIEAHETIYAWSANSFGNDTIFIADSLTEEMKAMFEIDLINNTFIVNPLFENSFYEKEEFHYTDYLGMACDYYEDNNDDNRFKTIKPGMLELIPVSKNQYALRVKQKAIVLV